MEPPPQPKQLSVATVSRQRLSEAQLIYKIIRTTAAGSDYRLDLGGAFRLRWKICLSEFSHTDGTQGLRTHRFSETEARSCQRSSFHSKVAHETLSCNFTPNFAAKSQNGCF